MMAAGVLSAAERWKGGPPEGFRKEIDKLRGEQRVPGLSAAWLENGRAGWMAGFGSVDQDGQKSVDEKTVFAAASLSKPVFSLAVLRFRDEGGLDLDRPLQDYLPFTDDERTRRITARHVLSHTSGLPNWRFKPGAELRANFEPGSRFGYSGEGFFQLQRVVEKLSVEPMQKFTRRRVFDALGLRDSSFLGPPVPGYDRQGQPSRVVPPGYVERVETILAEMKLEANEITSDQAMAVIARVAPAALPVYVSPNAAGSLTTTASDFAALMKALAQSKAMHEPLVQANGADWWGLGVGIERTDAGQYLWHWGNSPGAKCFFAVQAETATGIVVFTNGDNGLTLCNRIVTSALGHTPNAFGWIR